MVMKDDHKKLNTLLKRITNRDFTVGVIGLGYVGLPLLWTFHKNEFPVLGFDIDEKKIENIKAGRPYIKHLGHEMMNVLSDSNRCEATDDFSRVNEADAVLLCLPTPLDRYREPDMSYIEDTARQIGPHLRKEQLIVLESTTWPGTTEELLIPLLEQQSSMKAGNDFFVAYSPEREDPGNQEFRTEQIPKIIGGYGKTALQIAKCLYDEVIVETVSVSNTKTAEATKLTENIFRSVNIALVNELKVIFQSMDIDVHEVLDAAGTKPFGFMKFTPGPGLGGHCIPIDPFYLAWKAREYGQHTRFIELAGEINTAMPGYVVQQSIRALNKQKKSLNGSKLLMVGLAYKPDVDDMRESPAFPIMDLFTQYGAEVHYYDPYLPVIPPSREHKEWTGKPSVEWDEQTIRSFDAAVIVTDHSDVEYSALAKWCNCIIDTRNVMRDVQVPEQRHIWKA